MSGVMEDAGDDKLPAVVTRPIKTRSARNGPRRVRKKPASRPTQRSRKIRTVDRRVADDSPAARQRRAAGLLKLGQAYLGVGRKDQARKQFRKLLDEYSETPAAQTAKKLLAKCR